MFIKLDSYDATGAHEDLLNLEGVLYTVQVWYGSMVW
jgi:hypothetical protein